MKAHRIAALILGAVLLLTGIGGCADEEKKEKSERIPVKIGIVGESYAILWAPIIEEVAKEGIDISLVNFGDYSLPNAALNDGEIDLNAFQHHAYLRKDIAAHNYDIVPIGDTFLSAMCIYSDKLKNVSEIKEGGKVALPSDAVNLGRALSVLQGAGLIKLATAPGGTPELADIIDNPRQLEFVEIDAAQVPSLLPDVSIGIINGHFAVDFGFNPIKDAIFYDDPSFYTDDSYVNVIVARKKDAENPAYKRIVQAYQSPGTIEIFKTHYQGSFAPAWKTGEQR